MQPAKAFMPLLDWGKTVEAFIWFQRVSGHSSKTIEWHTTVLKLLDKFHKDENITCPSPQACTPEHIRTFLDWLRRRNLKVISIQTYFRSVRAFFNWCVREGLMEENPIVKVPMPKAEKPLPRTVTEEHLQKALSVLNFDKFEDLRNAALFVLAFDSGARLGELLRLKLGDIDLLQRVAKVQGKGGKERFIYFGHKTAQLLRKYLARRMLLLGTPTQDESLFVFRNGSPLDRRYALRAWHKAQKKAGLKVLPFHGLRHGFARAWLMAGGDGFSLQTLLGHSHSSTTERYVTLWGGDLQRLHAKFSPVDRLLRKT